MPKIGYHEGEALMRISGIDQNHCPSVESLTVAGRLLTLESVAGQANPRGWGDVHSAEARDQMSSGAMWLLRGSGRWQEETCALPSARHDGSCDHSTENSKRYRGHKE